MTKDLIQGARDFKRYQYDAHNKLMSELVEKGQHPEYFIISCIDSRSDPATLFRSKPGTFFSHKAMGAIVKPYEKGDTLAAAIKFAIKYNHVTKIIILGHTNCGAVNALVEGNTDEDIAGFVDIAQDALKRAEKQNQCEDSIHTRTEKEVVLKSIENLKTYPCVQEAMQDQTISISPWLFDMKTGNLLEYNEQADDFIVIEYEETSSDCRTSA